ncbi:hypothetical protein [Prosthecobacter sp.]|uniref:hypothetical protein n=1 Tax=Prosthecobacter sp. TaxID=1965333 RepID=UPI003783607D
MANSLLAQTESRPGVDPFANPAAFLTAAQVAAELEKDRKDALEMNAKAFKEPLMADIDTRVPSVRFVCIRTFHRPFCIRVFKDKDGPRIRVVRMDGKGGYGWGKIELDKTKSISEKEWKQVLTLALKPDVHSPLRALSVEERMMLAGLDGSTWYVESNAGGTPTFASVWTPESLLPQDGRTVPKGVDINPFYQFGLMLVKLAGMPVDDSSDPIY